MPETVTVVHPTGKREIGTIRHDRSGTGTQVCTDHGGRENCRSYPGPQSETKIVHDGGRSATRRL